MNPLTDSLVGSIVGVAGKVLDKIFPDPIAQASARLELLKLQQSGELEILANEVKLAQMQANVNIEEAKSSSVFVSGWRPAVGWTCAGGLFYQLLFRPIFGWVMQNWLHWNSPPSLELDTLMTLLFGMLGLGGYRTYEKVKGKA